MLLFFHTVWNGFASLQSGEHELPSPMDTDKVRCVLRSITRDWSAEGACERDMSYGPVLNTLER